MEELGSRSREAARRTRRGRLLIFALRAFAVFVVFVIQGLRWTKPHSWGAAHSLAIDRRASTGASVTLRHLCSPHGASRGRSARLARASKAPDGLRILRRTQEAYSDVPLGCACR